MNNMNDQYDIIVIGSGPGGYIAALKAAQMGARTAVVEKHHLGGTCLNYGCIPSKALLSSAELLHQIHESTKWGVNVGGDVAFDWKAIQKRKDKVVRQLRGGVGALFKGRKIALHEGVGQLNGPGKVVVTPSDGQPHTLTADRVILAVGSVPTRIPGWPDDPNIVCSSDEAVHWASLPQRLLIVGGGVIGCEFACMMSDYGVDVTIVEMMPRLLPGLDEDLADALQKIFESRRITIHLDTKVDDLQLAGEGAMAKLSNEQTLNVDRVLVSVGRSPNTKDVGLDRVGIETTRRGFVPVDDHMRTKAEGVYCIGDANGRCLLAHAASAHGVCAAKNALGHDKPFDAPIPSVIYTHPEIGGVGMTEKQAREQNLPISIGRFPLGHLGKAMASNHTDGLAKTIRHRETGALLGVHMIGHNATECIAAATAALHQKVSTEDLAETVFGHPTIAEAIKESAEDALGMGLHLPPRKVIRVPVAGA